MEKHELNIDPNVIKNEKPKDLRIIEEKTHNPRMKMVLKNVEVGV